MNTVSTYRISTVERTSEDGGINKHRKHRLTTREVECIKLISQGLSAHDAAAELGIASRTVERHLDQARLKMKARNRVHLVALAISDGTITFTA